MFLRTLRAERMKLRHSPVWLAFIILPILPAIMGTFNYLQNISILQDQWYSLWTQHTLFRKAVGTASHCYRPFAAAIK